MKRMFVVVALFLLMGITSANYISGDIYVYSGGEAEFDVQTDVDLSLKGLNFENGDLKGTTNLLTSKEGEIWSFKLDQGNYDDILLDINLPREIESIISIEGVRNVIDFDGRTISLIDREEDLSFEVKYSLGDSSDLSWFYFLLFILVVILIFVLIFRFVRKRQKYGDIFSLLNEKEIKIVDSLMKNPIRQNQLRKSLGIPKASFSRYVSNLEKKKLLVREGEGKNKLLKLK